MNALVKQQVQLPAGVQRLMALATADTATELSGGLGLGFPVISYKGKVWRIRESGDETLHLDAGGNAMPTIDVVLVQANPALAKIYYDKGFVEGTNEAPRCFSNNSIKPDASVVNPISPTCANCPKNAWGSKITEQGKKGKACQDSRRMAVVFANDLNENLDEAKKFLLRVPPASLNPIKEYADKALAPKGIPFYGIVTRIGFDPQSAHPQFTLKAARFLNDDEADAIGKMRGSEAIKQILADAQDFVAAAGAPAEEAPAEPEEIAPAPAPKAKPPTAAPVAKPAAAPKKAAMRPATEEEAGEATLAPEPVKPKAKPVVEADNEIAAAPAVKPKGKAASKPTPVVEEHEEIAAPASNDADNFDNLLDSILNG